MTKILSFDKNHIERAEQLALMNYNSERAIVTALPQIQTFPCDLEDFADDGLSVVMLDGEKLLGFLCCYEPWDNAFDSAAKGTFTPTYAHGAVLENKDIIYKRLYQAAAEKWVNQGITYHAIALYAHDSQAINAFYTYGFGMRCIDAVRPLTTIECQPCEGIIFNELAKENVMVIREMRKSQAAHLGESPCFMRSSDEDIEKWLNRAEGRKSRIFIAMKADKPIAFIEITDDGETFASEADSMMNICGAYCLPEHRGKGIVQGLLNYAINVLKTEGYESLGVDFESFNPTANGFWLKYFTAYTNSVVRRIDECALRAL
ncbi:MAG: GNAT family N-acetyltransferase [Turicibacter sp.]|nr:GNAT family N-acetyltransferase [Turicibacter sp.]